MMDGKAMKNMFGKDLLKFTLNLNEKCKMKSIIRLMNLLEKKKLV